MTILGLEPQQYLTLLTIFLFGVGFFIIRRAVFLFGEWFVNRYDN